MLDTIPAEGEADVDRRALLRVRFDRALLPRSIDGATVRLESGERRFALIARADPLLPGIEIEPRGELEPDVVWRLEIEGARDLDGEPTQAFRLRFRTGRTSTPVPRDETPSFPGEIGPLLREACGACHGGETPVLGLDLATAEGVRTTAIGRPSRELPSAPSASASGTTGGLGGMRRIEAASGAGAPETSYLVYKLLGEPHIAGDRMPPPRDGGAAGLDGASIARIALWIRRGAPLD